MPLAGAVVMFRHGTQDCVIPGHAAWQPAYTQAAGGASAPAGWSRPAEGEWLVTREVTGRRRWLTLAVCSLSAAAMMLEISKANLALVSIEAALGADPSSLALISVGYVAAFAVALIPAGRLGDRGHRRTLMLIGLLGVLVASTISALAGNIWVVVAARLLQGLSAGLVMPQVMGTVQQLFPGPERARAFAVHGMAMSLSMAVGPSVGGLLVPLGGPVDGWRWIFGMNIPVVLLLATGVLLLVPRQTAGTARRTIDVLGLILIAIVLITLLVPFVTTTGRPSDTPWRWLTLIGTVLAAALLWRWQRRARARGLDPLIDPMLVGTQSFRNGTLVAFAWFAGNPGMLLAVTVYLQHSAGLSPFQAGLIMLVPALASALASWLGGSYVLRFGRLLTAFGMCVALLGMAGTVISALLLPPQQAVLAIAITQIVAGFGGGFVISPNHVMTLRDVPPNYGSAAGSIGQLAQRVGNSLGLAGVSAVFFGIVYGLGGGLSTAPVEVVRAALGAAFAVSAAFIALALLLVAKDRRRERRVAGAAANDTNQTTVSDHDEPDVTKAYVVLPTVK